MDLLATVKKMVSAPVGGDHPANSHEPCEEWKTWSGLCSNEKPDTVKMDAAVPGMGGIMTSRVSSRLSGTPGPQGWVASKGLTFGAICTARRVPAG